MISSKVIYLSKKILTIYLVIVVAVYATILIADMGGYVDKVIKGQLREEILNRVKRDPRYSILPAEEQEKIIKNMMEMEIKARGLDKPYYIRSFIYLKNALTLDLGRALYLTSASGSRSVKIIIMERLPATVLLFTTATVLSFIINILVGLYCARNRGKIIDRIIVYFSVLSCIPGWFYGIIFILIFAFYLRILPYGGMVSVPPPDNPIDYSLDVLKHSILPISSWLFAGFFLGSYGNRNFFLIYSMEEYVFVARAKGLPERIILKNHILRPTLPTIVTNFSLRVIASWSGAMVTESVFDWPGIGRLTFEAIGSFDTPIIVGTTVVYAYLLGITVILLDLLYAYLDPRIKIGMG